MALAVTDFLPSLFSRRGGAVGDGVVAVKTPTALTHHAASFSLTRRADLKLQLAGA